MPPSPVELHDSRLSSSCRRQLRPAPVRSAGVACLVFDVSERTRQRTLDGRIYPREQLDTKTQAWY